MELLQHAQFDSVTFTSSGPNQAFSCLVDSIRELECLDVAGATTLRDLLNSTSFNSSFVDSPEGAIRANVLNQNDLMVNMMDPSVLDLSSTTLYGMGSTCDGKRVGDGVINGMDMYVYGASLFRLGPYASNPTDMSQILTVQGREDTQSRCSDDPYERVEWQKRLSYSSCFAVRDETAYQASLSGRRLLQATHYDELGTSLFVRGAEPAPATQLSNVPAPQYNTTHVPDQPNQFDMRFIRHRELAEQSTDECAIIQASGDALAALQSGWISLSQRLPGEGTQRGFLCGFDIVLWQPAWAKQGRPCPVQLSAGSTAMDGRLGAIQRFDICSEPLGALYLMSPPTTTPSSPLLSPPPAAPPAEKMFVFSESHVSLTVESEEDLYDLVSAIRNVGMQSYQELLDDTTVFRYNITRVLEEPSEHPAISYYSSRRLQESALSCPNGTKIRLQISIVCEASIDVADDPISPPPTPPPFPPITSEDDDQSMLVGVVILLGVAVCCCCGAAVVMRREKEKQEKYKPRLVVVSFFRRLVFAKDEEPKKSEESASLLGGTGNVKSACQPLLRQQF